MTACTPALYLIPTPLDFGCDTVDDISAQLPLGTMQRAATLTHFVVENAKSARAVLKRIDAVVPLAKPLQALQIDELPRLLHKKGDAAANELPAEALKQLLNPLQQGHSVGVMSEAGLPAIADPGAALVHTAHALGVPVVALPGSSALPLALAASGLQGQSFAFAGYLPVQADLRSSRMRAMEAQAYQNGQTQLCIETPHRNKALWQALVTGLQPQTLLCVASAVSLPNAWVYTRPVRGWRTMGSDAQLSAALEQPCIFLWGAP